MGIGGVVTFKNSGLDQTLKNVQLEHLVLETDSPYLAPVPFRGKRNKPGYLAEVLNKMSQIYGLSHEEVEEVTTRNAQQLFKLNQ
jgi:TatD DNase family protein